MRKKGDESDRSLSPSFCSNSECCCGCGDSDCSNCAQSDESRSSTPHAQDRSKRDSSSKEEARSPTDKGSSRTFSTLKSQKTKNSLNSSANSFKDDTMKWIERSQKYSSPAKENEKNEKSSLSTKVEKESKPKLPIEIKKVDKKSKPSSKEVEKEKLMPHLLALDKKVAKTLRNSPELKYESNGSDLESDYYVERKSPKKVKKIEESDKRGVKKMKRKSGEDVDRIRFTKGKSKGNGSCYCLIFAL